MRQLAVVRFKIVIATDVRISNEQDLRGWQLVALQMPTAWSAATISALSHPWPASAAASEIGGANNVAQAVTDSDGTALTISAAASKYIVFTTTEKEMVSGLAVTSLVASADQAADREIIGIVAPRD